MFLFLLSSMSFGQNLIVKIEDSQKNVFYDNDLICQSLFVENISNIDLGYRFYLKTVNSKGEDIYIYSLAGYEENDDWYSLVNKPWSPDELCDKRKYNIDSTYSWIVRRNSKVNYPIVINNCFGNICQGANYRAIPTSVALPEGHYTTHVCVTNNIGEVYSFQHKFEVKRGDSELTRKVEVIYTRTENLVKNYPLTKYNQFDTDAVKLDFLDTCKNEWLRSKIASTLSMMVDQWEDVDKYIKMFNSIEDQNVSLLNAYKLVGNAEFNSYDRFQKYGLDRFEFFFRILKGIKSEKTRILIYNLIYAENGHPKKYYVTKYYSTAKGKAEIDKGLLSTEQLKSLESLIN